MKSLLVKVFCLLVGVLGSTELSAQQDSATVNYYDVVYLKSGAILKGQILSFDELGGGIVLKDLNGRTYSISREEYKYFVEKQAFPVKKKKKAEDIRLRKDAEWEVHAGLSLGYVNIQHEFTPDAYFVNGVESQADIPLCLKLGAGKYLDRRNYVGFTSELALMSQSTNYLAAGVRLLHQYDAHKTNTAKYIPIELMFHHSQMSSNFGVADTAFDGQGGWSFPTYKDLSFSSQSLMLSAGHGFSFILENKKAVSLEFSIFRNFILAQSFDQRLSTLPESKFLSTGFKVGLIFNL